MDDQRPDAFELQCGRNFRVAEGSRQGSVRMLADCFNVAATLELRKDTR